MPIQILRFLRSARDSHAYFRRPVLVRLAILLGVFLPLVWLAVAAERTQLGAISQQESNRDLQNLTRAFAEEVNSTINIIDLSLIQLRSQWKRNPAQFPAVVDELNRELHGKVIMQVTVTDTRGIAVFTSGEAVARPVDLSDREHVRVHLDNPTDRLFVSRPVLSRISGQWALLFTRPLYGRDGRLAGVILAAVRPSYFSRFYSNIDLGKGASIGLVRFDGTVIARTTRSGGNADLGKVMKGAPYMPGHARAGHFRRVGQLDGIERYYAWRDLPDYDLMVTVGQAVDDAEARYARQKSTITLIGAAVSLLLALLGWAAITAADNRGRAVKALAAAEARWKLALIAGGEGVWDCNLRTGQATLSPRAQAILEIDQPLASCTADELRHRVHPEDLPRVMRALRDHLHGRTPDYVAEHRVRRRDGGWTWVLVRGMLAERAEDGRPLRMVGTFVNIDARKGREEQMRHQAHHDVLTGLPNRALMADRLQQAIRSARRARARLAVIYFDLDKFKPVNDTHGHAVGDRLLQQVATRVREGLRDSDTLARVGGDEFVVLLPSCASSADALTVGASILALLNREFRVGDLVLNISGSVGLAVYPDDAADGEELLRRADQAMYDAKVKGRGQVAHYGQPVA
ncbi:MAG: diguanylate cyclase domain-containing protein [Massilia sp.]